MLALNDDMLWFSVSNTKYSTFDLESNGMMWFIHTVYSFPPVFWSFKTTYAPWVPNSNSLHHKRTCFRLEDFLRDPMESRFYTAGIQPPTVPADNEEEYFWPPSQGSQIVWDPTPGVPRCKLGNCNWNGWKFSKFKWSHRYWKWCNALMDMNCCYSPDWKKYMSNYNVINTIYIVWTLWM